MGVKVVRVIDPSEKEMVFKVHVPAYIIMEAEFLTGGTDEEKFVQLLYMVISEVETNGFHKEMRDGS